MEDIYWVENGLVSNYKSKNSLYGKVTFRENANKKYPYYWEVRTLLITRESIGSPALTGFAPTLESAMKIVETLLKETGTI